MKNLASHIMDILQNSIRAAADQISCRVAEDMEGNRLMLEITDNGSGIPAELIGRVADPFFTTRTTRKVGLGLSLLKLKAEQSGGQFQLESRIGTGTRITASFTHSHLDRPILGDIPGVIVLTATAHPDIEFIYHHEKADQSFTFNSKEIINEIGVASFTSPLLLSSIKEYINENLKEIKVDLNS